MVACSRLGSIPSRSYVLQNCRTPPYVELCKAPTYEPSRCKLSDSNLHWQVQPREILAVHMSGGRCHTLLRCTSQPCADHSGVESTFISQPACPEVMAMQLAAAAQSPRHVPLSCSPWTVARQAPVQEIPQARVLAWAAISLL